MTKNELNLYSFGFVLTHKCNKNCEHCIQRIHESDYEYMSDEEFEFGIQTATQYDGFTQIIFTGGEALMHPHIKKFVKRAMELFPDIDVVLVSNGILIPKFEKLFQGRAKAVISLYPGFNDRVARKYRHHPNMHITRYHGFRNPEESPNLSEAKAKIAMNKCAALTRLKVHNWKIYECCLSCSIQKKFPEIGCVNIPLDNDWLENIDKFKTYKACAHCPLKLKERRLSHE